MPLAMRLSRFGVGNLRLEQLPPEPLSLGMVRVAFAAVSLNHRDLLVIRGAYGPDLTLPLIPCSDAAGGAAGLHDDDARFRGVEKRRLLLRAGCARSR